MKITLAFICAAILLGIAAYVGRVDCPSVETIKIGGMVMASRCAR